MKLKKRINIELLSKSLTKHIPVIQNDRGRIIECYITDCQIPTGTKVKFWAMKPSKKLVYNDCTLKDNVVSVELTNQALAEKGSVACQLEFDGDVSSYEFFLDVERDISGNGVVSENESTVLDAFLEEMRVAIANVKSETEKAKAATAEAKKATEEAIKATQESVNPIKEVKGSDITADQTHQGAAIIKELQGELKQEKTQGRNLVGLTSGFTIDNAVVIDTEKNELRCDINKKYYAEIKIDTSSIIKSIVDNKGNKINFRCEYKKGEDYKISMVIFGKRESGLTFQEITAGDGIKKIGDAIANDFTEVTQVAIRLGRKASLHTNTTTIYKNLMLWIGDDEPLFEPYTGAEPSPNPDYPQVIKGLIMKYYSGKAKIGGYYVEDGLYRPSYTSYVCDSNETYIPCNTGDIIEIQTENNMKKKIVYTYDSNRKIINNKIVDNGVYTVENGVKYVRFDMEQNGNTVNLDAVGEIKVLKNKRETGLVIAAKDNEKTHKMSIVDIPLDSPLYEGDRIYLEDGELWEYRENARTVFDGSEDEEWGVQSLNHTKILNTWVNIKTAKKSKNDKVSITRAGIAGVGNDSVKNIHCINTVEDALLIDVDKDVFRTLQEFINYLKSNPIEFVYKLKTPTLKKLGSAEAFNLRAFDERTYIEVVGAKELGTENTFIVPRNQSGGLMTDAFATSKRNEINAAGQANLASRISALEQLAVKEGV